MELDEIQRFLYVSLAHSVVVDVCEIDEAPGYLRTITIHSDNAVTIEYQSCSDYLAGDIEGAGLKLVGAYETLERAICDLEEFLGRPVAEWKNLTEERYAPVCLAEEDPENNLKYFERMVREDRISFPKNGKFRIAGIYWRHLRRYGEYRPDKLLEEQELELAEQE